jgi:hypothetical protein
MSEPTKNDVPALPYWHYSSKGERYGPVTADDLVELINQNMITEKSLVWNINLSDWIPILESEFETYLRDITQPPPLSGSAVNNTYVWILAFAPIIGSIFEGLVGVVTGISLGSLWIITVVLNVVLCNFDEKKLRNAGYDTSKLGSYFVVPIYLYNRTKLLKQNYGYFITWCLVFLLLLFPSSPLMGVMSPISHEISMGRETQIIETTVLGQTSTTSLVQVHQGVSGLFIANQEMTLSIPLSNVLGATSIEITNIEMQTPGFKVIRVDPSLPIKCPNVGSITYTVYLSTPPTKYAGPLDYTIYYKVIY